MNEFTWTDVFVVLAVKSFTCGSLMCLDMWYVWRLLLDHLCFSGSHTHLVSLPLIVCIDGTMGESLAIAHNGMIPTIREGD